MNPKLKKLVTNFRVLLVLFVLILAIVAINPSFNSKGVAIRSVDFNSSASTAGIYNPSPGVSPRSREVVLSMNNEEINSLKDYNDFIQKLSINQTVNVKTSKASYILRTKPNVEIKMLNETESKVISEVISEDINGTIVNRTVTKTLKVPKTIEIVNGAEDLGLTVYPAPQTNIKKGLDLQGGTRVLLQPEQQISKDDMELVISSMKERLNVFGLSDIIVRSAGDLSGNQFILVEIAGANEDEVKELLARQGKFEANIGNDTVFFGGKKDITYVCRTADCSGIDPRGGCNNQGSAWYCRFRFAISLSPEAAERQAQLTQNLDLITQNNEQYLSKPLVLYLDDKEVDQLNIGAELKGRATTDIQISGSGVGKTQEEAITDSLTNMKRLQTILITGSLPVKLNIVSTDSVSPELGEEFLRNSLFIGILSLLGVCVLVFLRYRKWFVAIPMIITSLIELVVIIGVASAIGWNLDISSVAGIIIAIGTGVNDQIIIADETLKGAVESYDWKRKIKNAFFIIFGAFFTNFVAMVPLLFAGAGLLKGFAITTIIGLTFGVLITRPAYARVMETLLKE